VHRDARQERGVAADVPRHLDEALRLDPVLEGVGAVLPMDGHALSPRHQADDAVPRHRVAALRDVDHEGADPVDLHAVSGRLRQLLQPFHRGRQARRRRDEVGVDAVHDVNGGELPLPHAREQKLGVDEPEGLRRLDQLLVPGELPAALAQLPLEYLAAERDGVGQPLLLQPVADLAPRPAGARLPQPLLVMTSTMSPLFSLVFRGTMCEFTFAPTVVFPISVWMA